MTDKTSQNIKGIVIEALPNTMFRVETEDKKIMLCHLSGKMRLNKIRVMVGDEVELETNPYDDKRGRIIYRKK